MTIRIARESSSILEDYSTIPISFQVNTVLCIEPLEKGLKGFRFSEERVETPYVKDYDEDEEDTPLSWPHKWDVSNWGFFPAYEDGKLVGGAAVAYRTQGIFMLEGRSDICALWDIRVAPEHRRKGVGTELFDAVKRFAVERQCRFLKIETQNINVPACRFYLKQGCELGAVNRYAYASYPSYPHPEETQFVWYLALTGNR